MKKTNLKAVPKFKNEDEEARFWNTHDSTDYVDWDKAVRAEFSNLKPTTQTITLRVPLVLLNDIRRIANKKDVPYQSLMKIFLAEKTKEEDLLYQ